MINASNNVISTLTYPALTSDNSYGVGETVNETSLVAQGATATYYSPANNSLGTAWTVPGFNDSTWSSGPTGLGTNLDYASVPGFATILYQANTGVVGSVAQAEAVISTSSEQAGKTSETSTVLDFLDTGPGGHFTSTESAFPGLKIGDGGQYYVLQATGTLTISASQAGYYTFGVNSDDGFSLTITGADFTTLTNATNSTGTGTMADDALRGASDTLGTTYLAKGTYPINLVYYQNQGLANLEFYAAKESSAAGATTFDANSVLVGNTAATTASGGTSTTTTPLLVTSEPVAGASALDNDIQTNVSSTVKAAIAAAGGTSLYSRISFGPSAASLASLTSLTLQVQYDSGYVAYLNGVEIASRNAPSSTTWNSDALEYRNSPVQATTYEDVDITPDIAWLSPQTVSSVTSSGTTATVTLPNNGFFNGETITIAGASQPEYDGSFVLSNVTANSFTYTISGSPVSPATGTITACPTTDVLAVQTLMATPADQDFYVSPAITGNIAITQVGLKTFAEPTPGMYNTPGSWQPDLTFSVQHGFYSATFPLTLSTTTPGASIYYTTDNSTPGSQAITSITFSGTTATATTADAVAFVSGDEVQITGATPAVYDGEFVITGTGVDTFTYTLLSTPTSNASGTGMTVADGTLYTGPITISTTTDVRAVSVLGGQSGVVSTASYIFLASVINQPANPPGFPTVWGETTSGTPQPTNYAMNPAITQNPLYSAGLTQDLLSLPTVSITTDIPNMWSAAQSASTNSGIYTNEENLTQSNGVSITVPASFEYFNPNGTTSLQANMGLQLEGGVGRYPQYDVHSFRMEFSSDYGAPSLNYPLFPGDPVTSFQNVDLKAGFDDVWSWAGSGTPPGDAAQYMRDIFASNTFSAMGQTSFHSNYVFLYVDGLFWGMYMMDERPDADFAASYLGGTASDYEANNGGHEVSGSANSLPYWNALQNLPSTSSFATTSLAFYEQTQGNNVNGTPNSSYIDLLDMTNYIDYMLENFYTGNTDWPWHNFYAAINAVDPTGFQIFPWDTEMSLGIINGGFNSGLNANVLGIVNGAVSYSSGNGVATLYAAMFKNPEFDLAFADQSRQFLFDSGALTPTASIARYQSQINTIDEAMVAESARWGNISTSPGPLPNTQAAWLNEAEWITGTYLPQRTSILISQLQAAGLYPAVSAPEFYVNGVDEYGGTFNPGNTLTMLYGPTGASLPAGAVIYYTLDGSDPRQLGGALNTASDVLQYTGPITLTQGEEVRARIFSGGTWSAISEAQFVPNFSSLRVTEVMYDPSPATAAETAAGYVSADGKEDFEFLEIQNTGMQTLPLGGLQISGGITFTFPTYQGNVSTNPLLTVAPGGYVVAVSDLSAFTIRYGAELAAEFGSNWQNLIVAGQYAHHLNNSGETIELSSPNGGVVQNFTYQNSWYPQTQGGGFSLTIRSSAQATSLWDSAAGWGSSGAPNGTPGTAETTPIPLPGAIVINEVLANPATAGGDLIELYNTTSQAINVGGWWLSDIGADLTMYRIAANTSIAAGAYLVLSDSKNYGPGSGDSGALVPFSLNKYGFSVYLSSNANGAAGGYQEEETYGATPLGVAVGLVTTSTGESDFVLLASANFGQPVNGVYPGAANSMAFVSPIVMTALEYDPSQPTAAETAAGFTDGDDFEYVELYNRSNTTQTLTNYFMGGGVGFTFGWVPDGAANESETLESGAASTWTTNALAAGAYTVYANYHLTDAQGNTRDADSNAQYTITYPGGSTTVTVDQSTAVNGKLDLGTITITGPGQVQVQLLRQSTAKPSQWTLANQVEFVGTSVDLTVGSPALTSYSASSGITTLAPGAYLLLVSDRAAFDFRYGAGLPVAGQYTGHQSNSGELISVDQFGAADPVTGYVPSYAVDLVNYGIAAPWPTQPAGGGPALIRVHVADYGNDPLNWLASGDGPVTNVGASPGAGNLTLDPLPPSVPTGLAGHGSVGPGEVTLTWTASSDPRSDVAYYIIYRNGSSIGTSTTTTFADTTVTAGTNYSYTVAAVNRDGYASAQSAAIDSGLPAITSAIAPTSMSIAIYFSEPLTASVATNRNNYSVSGLALNGLTLGRDGTLVTLSLTSALAVGTIYTVTLMNLTTVSGDALPATQTFSFTYAAYIAPNWSTTLYRANVTVASVANAQTVISTPSQQSSVTTQTENVLNLFMGGNASGYFANGNAFPGMTPSTSINNFVVQATGTIVVLASQAGYYTFGVTSDDGFSISITGANFTALTNATNSTGTNTMAYANTRAPGDTLGTTYLAAGNYPVNLVYFQDGGGAELEVYAAKENSSAGASSFDPNSRLVGDTANGGLQLGTAAVVDTTPPSAPANLRAAVTGSNNQITLTWSPVQDLTSGIADYQIYRNGVAYATSTTTSFTDTSGISSRSQFSYEVAAVNYDGLQGASSLAVSLSAVGIASISTPTTTSVLVTFSEPVDSVSSQAAGNYAITGATVSSAVLQSNGCSVLLTTSALGAASHTLTISNVTTRALTALPALTSSFTYALPGWTATVYTANVTVASVAQAQTVISTPSQQTSVTTQTGNVLNFFMGGDTSGYFANGNAFPGMTLSSSINNFVVQATGTIVIAPGQAGNYTFGVTSDDGFSLSITSADFTALTNATNSTGTNTMVCNNVRSPGDTLGTTFLAAGSYPVNLVYFQNAGGAELEFYAASGSYTSVGASPPWELVGDNIIGGPTIGSAYVAPPFSVAVNPLTTNITSPAVSGTVSDPLASLSVRVNGNWYGVANNNGAWTLLAGEISPALANGTYDVEVCGVNTSGQVAFDSTLNELTVNTASPTVTLQSIATLAAPISSLSIVFSEPVSGFSEQNLQATLNGIALPLDGATLTTSDDQHWTLGNLSSLTDTSGVFSLTVSPAGWGVTDAEGNVFSSAATTTGTLGPTVATPASASSSPVVGSTTGLSVLGAEAVTGESNLTYTWVATGLPNGAAAPIFSVNGTNAAKNTTATFSTAGNYNFTVTILDAGGLSVTSTVSATVNQTYSGVNISPTAPSLTGGATQQFTATALDQFGQALASQPTITWTLVSGPGSLTNTGLYTPPYATGSAVVQATSGAYSASANVTFSSEAQWNAASDDSWTTGGDWIDAFTSGALVAPGVRGVTGDTVLFPTTPLARLDGATPTLAAVIFNNAGASYGITQGSGGALTLQGALAGSGATVSVQAGNPAINAPVHLTSNTVVGAAASTTLTMMGPIDGAGSLTTTGSGKLYLNGANTFSGGLIVQSGTVVVSAANGLADGSSLTVGSAAAFSASVVSPAAAPAVSSTQASAATPPAAAPPAAKSLSPRGLAAVMAGPPAPPVSSAARRAAAAIFPNTPLPNSPQSTKDFWWRQ